MNLEAFRNLLVMTCLVVSVHFILEVDARKPVGGGPYAQTPQPVAGPAVSNYAAAPLGGRPAAVPAAISSAGSPAVSYTPYDGLSEMFEFAHTNEDPAQCDRAPAMPPVPVPMKTATACQRPVQMETKDAIVNTYSEDGHDARTCGAGGLPDAFDSSFSTLAPFAPC